MHTHLGDVGSTLLGRPLADVRHAPRAQPPCHIVPNLQRFYRLRNAINRLSFCHDSHDSMRGAAGDRVETATPSTSEDGKQNKRRTRTKQGNTKRDAVAAIRPRSREKNNTRHIITVVPRPNVGIGPGNTQALVRPQPISTPTQKRKHAHLLAKVPQQDAETPGKKTISGQSDTCEKTTRPRF